ncbi:epiplakin-like [Sceloporus undulatus]|uniref:epiplakin-like n=1 Tax=Sceloporus undulatus TaxID=8520 RepID=UPI001C4CDA9F|nr:epiplakin-like [Sceloporus undulatus]
MKYRYGILSIEEMIVTLAPLLTQKDPSPGKVAEEGSSPASGWTHAQDGGAPRLPQDGDLENALRLVSIEVPAGEFQGSRRSAWELLFSKYVTVEKRQELLEKYWSRLLSTSELVQIITSLIEEMEEKSNQLKFTGLRRQVTASELFSSQIIDQETLSELTQGTKTVEEITKMDSVKRYLEGTSCIAGVLVPSRSDPSKTEKMTIYQAMWKSLLRPGTALVLLEAQAATGFITDPVNNRKLSVEEAVSAGLVGAELREKLLSAERAVTGYRDPYTGSKISLFQAMKKGLIVKDHGIRLLEAQIATGGIIDPIHSHRLPVEVAYKRGYFDEEMNRVLSDPTDDTKGFFDPNTHENLTYMQLLLRCFPDPETDLLMLHVMDKGSFSFHLTENTRRSLQVSKTRVGLDLFQGQEVSLWDLLFSRYILPQKRQELLRQYKTGTVTLEDLTQILTTTVTETEEKRAKPTGPQEAPSAPDVPSPKDGTDPGHVIRDWQRALQSTTIHMPAGEHQGQPVIVWDLLLSNYITEEKRTELLDLYQGGLLPIDQLLSILTALIKKEEATSRKFNVKVWGPDQEMATREGASGMSFPGDQNWESALRSQFVQVDLGGFEGQKFSLWELLFSGHVSEFRREELLSQFQNGSLTLEELTNILGGLLTEAKSREGKHPTTPDVSRHDDDDDDDGDDDDVLDKEEREEDDDDTVELGEKEKALKSRYS